MIAFAQVVAREHAGDGDPLQRRRCPAMIDTPANRAAMPPAQHASLTPPGEIARVIRFLCSDESAPTSGAAIPVYGGPYAAVEADRLVGERARAALVADRR